MAQKLPVLLRRPEPSPAVKTRLLPTQEHRTNEDGGSPFECRRLPLLLRDDQIRAPLLQVARQRARTSEIPKNATTDRPAKIRKPGAKLPVNCLAMPSDEAR